MIDALPDGRLVEIPGASHTIPADQPEAFARAVRDGGPSRSTKPDRPRRIFAR
jgi:pimeloyl-ACP methyl ester carboxylesterase